MKETERKEELSPKRKKNSAKRSNQKQIERVEIPRVKRASFGKSMRFSIFARDNFTCRYCGAQADTVTLVIDHLIPICKGGTNDESNLITACEPCNQGKSGKLINDAALSDADRLKFAQERNEQIKFAHIAQEAADAKKALQNVILKYWCEARGRKTMERKACITMASFAAKHGPVAVLSWIDIAADRLDYNASDTDFCKYICGIRRSKIQKGEIEE